MTDHSEHDHGDRDRLAHERTILANQRTMLANFRTGFASIGTGLLLFKFFPELGTLSLIATIALVGFGLFFLVSGIVFYPTRNRYLRSFKRRLAHTDELIDELIDDEEDEVIETPTPRHTRGNE